MTVGDGAGEWELDLGCRRAVPDWGGEVGNQIRGRGVGTRWGAGSSGGQIGRAGEQGARLRRGNQ